MLFHPILLILAAFAALLVVKGGGRAGRTFMPGRHWLPALLLAATAAVPVVVAAMPGETHAFQEPAATAIPEVADAGAGGGFVAAPAMAMAFPAGGAVLAWPAWFLAIVLTWIGRQRARLERDERRRDGQDGPRSGGGGAAGGR